jgi:hypothetical protein
MVEGRKDKQIMKTRKTRVSEVEINWEERKKEMKTEENENPKEQTATRPVWRLIKASLR